MYTSVAFVAGPILVWLAIAGEPEVLDLLFLSISALVCIFRFQFASLPQTV